MCAHSIRIKWEHEFVCYLHMHTCYCEASRMRTRRTRAKHNIYIYTYIDQAKWNMVGKTMAQWKCSCYVHLHEHLNCFHKSFSLSGETHIWKFVSQTPGNPNKILCHCTNGESFYVAYINEHDGKHLAAQKCCFFSTHFTFNGYTSLKSHHH